MELSNSRVMHEIMRDITGYRRPTRTFVIKEKEGNMMSASQKIIKRRVNYITELFEEGIRGDRLRSDADISRPQIPRSEIENHVKGIRCGKTAGEDEIVVDMIEVEGEFMIENITSIANTIYYEGYTPEAMRESVLVTKPKKPGGKESKKHRTNSILSKIELVL